MCVFNARTSPRAAPKALVIMTDVISVRQKVYKSRSGNAALPTDPHATHKRATVPTRSRDDMQMTYNALATPAESEVAQVASRCAEGGAAGGWERHRGGCVAAARRRQNEANGGAAVVGRCAAAAGSGAAAGGAAQWRQGEVGRGFVAAWRRRDGGATTSHRPSSAPRRWRRIGGQTPQSSQEAA